MKLTSHAFADNAPIPSRFAFCKPDAATHAGLSDNLSPDLAWADLPAGTKSLVLLCCDPDVPSEATDVNQEGRTIPKSLARIDFFHWVLVDIPASLAGLKEGEFSDSVTAKGKPGPQGPHGTRQGVNDYTTMVRARLGTIRSSTTTCSRCMRSMSSAARSKAASPAPTCAPRSPRTRSAPRP